MRWVERLISNCSILVSQRIRGIPRVFAAPFSGFVMAIDKVLQISQGIDRQAVTPRRIDALNIPASSIEKG
jgi:hypothetical protein